MPQGGTIADHIRKMEHMLSELRQMSCILIENQKMIVLSNSLPKSRSHMRMILDHNDAIKAFDDYAYHLVH